MIKFVGKHGLLIVLYGVALVISSDTSATGQVTVGPNVQVSRERAGVTHTEVLAAADLKDAKRLMACSIIGPSPDGKTITGTYASFDGGATWAPVVVDGDQFESFDPACTYGIEGVALFASLSRGRDFIPRLNAYHSEDGGRIWAQSNILTGNRY